MESPERATGEDTGQPQDTDPLGGDIQLRWISSIRDGYTWQQESHLSRGPGSLAVGWNQSPAGVRVLHGESATEEGKFPFYD